MFEMYNADLVATRLNRAIVRIDGKYQFIMEIGGSQEKGFFALTPSGRYNINQYNVSYDDMCIGMVILSGAIYWSYRLPVRRWKAGLNANNYAIHTLGGERWVFVKKQLFEGNINNICDMLTGKYLRFHEAVHYMGGIVSQHFAVNGTFLFYKSKYVASIENNQAIFTNKYKYLREKFQQETECIPV